MKRNGAWKRAGCVLLAAQMTVGVLPLNAVAASHGSRGRSEAILSAAKSEAAAVHSSRVSFLTEKSWMPLMTRPMAVRNVSRNEALPSLTDDKPSVTVDTDKPEEESGATTVTPPAASIPGGEEGTDAPATGDVPSTDVPAGSELPVTPSPGEEEPPSPETGTEEVPTETASPGESIPGASSPVESEAPGGSLEEISGDPVPLPGPSEEEPPVLLPPEGEQSSLGAVQFGLENNPVPLDAAMYWVDEINIGIFGYNHWASPEAVGESSINPSGGRDMIFSPYYPEFTQPGHILEALGYINNGDGSNATLPEYIPVYTYNTGTSQLDPDQSLVDEAVAALKDMQLDRIPDMLFKGWCFSQVSPEAGREEDKYWYTWYQKDLPADDYVPDRDALVNHASSTEMVDMGLDDYDWYQHRTEVVAKWVDSDRADLTDLKLNGYPIGKSGDGDKVSLELYDVDFKTTYQGLQSPVSLRSHTAGGSFTDEYYVQAPVGIDRLTLDFTTYEPGTMVMIQADTLSQPILYRYDRQDYMWHSVLENGEAIPEEEYGKRNRDETSLLERQQPGRRTSSNGAPTNTAADPARAIWSLPVEVAIPLDITSPSDVYTDVTITVVAPDGTLASDGTTTGSTAEYTLHVRRMADPVMTLELGNTPYGVIGKDTQTTHSKEELRTEFDSHRIYLKDASYSAYLADHNGGAVYTGAFSAGAWLGTDYDREETALVVYQDTTFTDPGFRLIDSQGESVDSTKVHHSIRLRRVSALTTANIHEGAGEEVYYQNGALVPAAGGMVKELVVTPGGKDQISLKDLHVVPGIYTIEYSYDDPASDITYDSVSLNVYMDQTKAIPFSRTLIVLPKPGDVDMDGMVTLADAIALEELWNTPGSFLNVDTSDEVERLFKYRVCDVDGDGQVTGNDVDTLKNGYVPRVVSGVCADLFYLNSGDNGEPPRKDLSTETPSQGKASISVEYLGKNINGVPSGPSNSAELELGETFWVGVRLENAAALSGVGLKGLEFTLAYNSDILEPGLLKGDTQWWQSVTAANLSSGSATPWKDAYTLVGNSGPGGALASYPELAVPTLNGTLSTYTFALQLKQGQTAASLQDGYLLYVPFTMKIHPVGVEHDTVALIEPVMGGREFTLSYVDGSVGVWSEQGVFGGTSGDLKAGLAYAGTTEIPIGEDKTVCITLFDDETGGNAQYGEEFTFTNYGNNDSGANVDLIYGTLVGELPSGMRFDPNTGTISTDTPSGATQAGRYRFYIDSNLYQIYVDKAPLTLTVDGTGGKYYGEPNPDSTAIEFGYDRSQLKKPELDRINNEGLNNDGKGTHLSDILADEDYERPIINMEDANGVTLASKTPAGSYVAKLTGGKATNYVFRYLSSGETVANDQAATNTFTVNPRPIVVDKIEGPVATLESVPKNGRTLQLTAPYGSGATTFTAAFPPNRDPGTGSVGGSHIYRLTGSPVVTGDPLTISYSGTFIMEPKDNANEFVLDPGHLQEERTVEIVNPTLSGVNAGNYAIYYTSKILPVGSINATTTGTVKRMAVTKLEMRRNELDPLKTDYTYGEELALGHFSAKLTWANGESSDWFTYNPESNEHGLSLCWVEKTGDAPSEAPAYDKQYLSVKEQDGKYLCFYMSNGSDMTPAYVCSYWGPFTVKKAELTLTVDSETRYYGEPDAAPRITYQHADLVGEDYRDIWQYGTLQDLEGRLEGFQSLEITHRETASANGKLVTDRTDAGNYYVVIAKAVADNYLITYRQPGKTEASSEFGYASMTVRKRPIQVKSITGSVGFLYDDTSAPVLGKVEGTAPKAAGQSFAFETARPSKSTYYVSGGSAYAETLGSLTGDAILSGDTLGFFYRATFDADDPNKPPFFQTSGWTSDTKSYGVTIDNLQLDSTVGAGRNYQLVHDDNEKALYGRPEDSDRGTGDVVIRRIDSLEVIRYPAFMDYTYGDPLQLDGTLTVRIHYKSAGGYSSYTDVTYTQKKLDGQVVGDTFADNGLWIEWSDENGNAVTGQGDAAAHDQLMTVVDHNGKYLVVKGKRHPNHDEKVVVANKQAFTVEKKVIHLQPADITRGYGEENLSGAMSDYYRVTTDWLDDLIQQDKDKLTSLGYTDVDGTADYDPSNDLSIMSYTLTDRATSLALSALDPTFRGPYFHTSASKDRPVGVYNITMSDGEMANYAFAFAPGRVEVTKRRIYLRDVEKRPLATMVSGSPVYTMRDVTATSSEVTFGFEGSGTKAVLDGDEITVSMTVEFGYDQNGRVPYSDLVLGPGEVTRSTWIMVSNVKLVLGNENYELISDRFHNGTSFHDPTVPIEAGRIDGRRIKEIRLSNPAAVKTNYAYGEGLDLLGARVDIYYDVATAEIDQKVDRNVDLSTRGGFSVHYLADPTLAQDPNNYGGIADGTFGAEAHTGDHLTIAPDENGFAHQGKYLVISAAASEVQGDYVPPIVVSAPINIAKRQLSYTLTAEDKDYDGTTKAQGTVRVDQNQIYEDDVVYIDNGTRYDDMVIDQDGVDYVFHSNPSYGIGVTFDFADPNVAYEQAPGHDAYGAVKSISVAVSKISLSGKDAANYDVIGNVAADDSAAPFAVIRKARRVLAPDVIASVAERTNMSTDIHTNTMIISVDAPAVDYGDKADIYNGELHFEYKLEYLVDEADLDAGFTSVEQEDKDSVFFGGEPVEEVSEEFEPAQTEQDKLTPGMGQPIVEGDPDFGAREPLPRDTYFRACVRLAETHNYLASEYVPSIADDEMVAAVAAARGAEESDEVDLTVVDPKEIEPPRPIADHQRLGKTYQYRFDVIATQTMQGTDGKEHARTQLDSVWFADRATYPTENHLNALITDPVEPRYHSYAWDAKQNQRVNFPLDMTKEIEASLPQADGSSVVTVVNRDGTARLYASLEERSSGGVYYTLWILNGDIEAHVGDDPVQLDIRMEPNRRQGVRWSSSDPTVAEVDKDGLLTFVGEGTAVIRASYGTSSDTIEVTVLPAIVPVVIPTSPFDPNYLGAFMDLSESLEFYPERTVSRGELAVILSKLVHPDFVIPEEEIPGYVDISPDMACAQAVDTLGKIGVMKGIGEERFAPEQIATRAEIATVIVRMSALPDAPAGQQSFLDDGPEDTWANREIEALVQAGITEGSGEGYFSPNRLLTRAEVAAFLTRMLQCKLDPEQKGLVRPIDVTKNHWAWKEIMQAVNGAKLPEESQ